MLGYPLESLRELPTGTYTVQALLHRYETFRRADGHVVKLPDGPRRRPAVEPRARATSTATPRKVALDPRSAETIAIALDQVIPPIADPPETRYIKHERIQSERLTKFWGRPMYLGAHVLLPEGFDCASAGALPAGHQPRPLPGDVRRLPRRAAGPEPEARAQRALQLAGYNRTVQEHEHQLFKDWTAPGFPRVIIVEIQHANPYYDDSYAVNSANLGPYGDAITYELIPYLEKKYRAIGAGWARFMYGGSTGGWEAMAAQIFYPDEYNGAWIACPDPIDFRAYTVVDLYKDKNAYLDEGPFLRTPRPAMRNYLGHVKLTLEAANRIELVLGTKSRSGQQWDIWEAVYSPVGEDGYPKRDLGQAHRRHRSRGGRALARELRPRPHPAPRLEQGARAQAPGQAATSTSATWTTTT